MADEEERNNKRREEKREREQKKKGRKMREGQRINTTKQVLTWIDGVLQDKTH
jgi:hypothetical protein